MYYLHLHCFNITLFSPIATDRRDSYERRSGRIKNFTLSSTFLFIRLVYARKCELINSRIYINFLIITSDVNSCGNLIIFLCPEKF